MKFSDSRQSGPDELPTRRYGESALPPKAAATIADQRVRFGPKGDINGPCRSAPFARRVQKSIGPRPKRSRRHWNMGNCSRWRTLLSFLMQLFKIPVLLRQHASSIERRKTFSDLKEDGPVRVPRENVYMRGAIARARFFADGVTSFGIGVDIGYIRLAPVPRRVAGLFNHRRTIDGKDLVPRRVNGHFDVVARESPCSAVSR
jgi:hypothetical protein